MLCYAKASRAVRSLRFAHAQYVGWLRAAAQCALSCGRDGELQLWRHDTREGYVPWPGGRPRDVDLSASWLLDVCAAGVLAVCAAGTVNLWAWGADTPTPLRRVAQSSLFLDSPCESHCALLPSGGATVAFVGLRSALAAGGSNDPKGGGAVSLKVELLRRLI
jgi:hypothetical protein